MLALDAGRFEEFARKSKSIVGARDTGRPAPIAEPARIPFSITKRADHSHVCPLGAVPPAHGCRAILPAPIRRGAAQPRGNAELGNTAPGCLRAAPHCSVCVARRVYLPVRLRD